jgi:probable F420-dependent oxidoreductase
MSTKHLFRFGCINEMMLPARQWRDHVRKMEALGYDILLMRDHFLPDVFGDTFGPIAALMSAADATSQLRVGSMVICNDFRHPAVLAKEAATIDYLSDGRFELGLGAGWMRAEYDQMGIEFDLPGLRIERLEESVQVIRGLLADSPFTHTGGHYQIKEINGFPKPFQKSVPIMIGGGNKRILALAGHVADIVGILVTNVASGVVVNDPRGRLAESVLQRIAWVKEGAGERFEDIELNSAMDVVVTDNRRFATERFIEQHGWQGISVEQVWDMPSVFIGTVDHIVDELVARRERFGFSYYWVADANMENFAPIVAQLRGK